MNQGKYATRSRTEQFLVGQPSPDLPDGLLPSYSDVLKDVLWKKAKMGNQLPTKDVVCCDMQHGGKESGCGGPMGCLSKSKEIENMCTVGKVKEKWKQAGFKTVNDNLIKNKIVEVSSKYQRNIKKRRKRNTKGAVEERDKFKTQLDMCFDISSADVIKAIECDKKRTKEDIVRDKAFLEDQLNERKMMFTVVDKRYQTVVMSAALRAEAKQKAREMEKLRVSQLTSFPGFEADSQDDGMADDDTQEEEEEELESPSKSQRKKGLRARKISGKTISLEVPMDIVAKTASAASALKLSIGQHIGILSAFILASGGDIDDFPISDSSARRDRRKANSDSTESIKDAFKAAVGDGDKRLIAHFDGKMLEELGSNKVNKDKKDRLAILVRSPDLENKEQLLGIPALNHSTGVAQQEAVMNLLDEWGATESLVGLVYDTTASNTGNKTGSVIRIERKLNRSLLKMPCRRHVHELHAKHVAFAVSGRVTTGPGDVLFKTFSSAWDELQENIDYDQLSKFDWKKHQKLEDKAHSVLLWAKSILAEKVFARADYLQLAELIVVWLGGVVHNFAFHKPKKVSSARFMQRAIYYITMELLSYQYELFDEQEIDEIEIMAEFCAIFYGPWFLRSPGASSAPYNDLVAMKEMRDYRKHRGVEAAACLVSWDRHLDYLSPALVVFSLASSNVSDNEKKSLADALVAILTTEDVSSFPPGDGYITVPSPDFASGTKFWPEDSSLPSLSMFVGKESWLLFHYLDMMNIDDMEWIMEEVNSWETFSSFRKFKNFVKGLDCINDPAERTVKLAQDFIKDNTTVEQNLQNEYIVVAEHRKAVKGNKHGRKDKCSLKRMAGK